MTHLHGTNCNTSAVSFCAESLICDAALTAASVFAAILLPQIICIILHPV